MKTFSNANPKDVREAVALLGASRNAALVGGGSDLLGMVKERLVSPDVLVNLKAVRGLESGNAIREAENRRADHA